MYHFDVNVRFLISHLIRCTGHSGTYNRTVSHCTAHNPIWLCNRNLFRIYYFRDLNLQRIYCITCNNYEGYVELEILMPNQIPEI